MKAKIRQQVAEEKKWNKLFGKGKADMDIEDLAEPGHHNYTGQKISRTETGRANSTRRNASGGE
jgi:hypothetical protein